MRNTFSQKVSVEREALSIINTLTPGVRQLTGLSSVAIESWRRTANIEKLDDLVSLLLRIAALSQCLSDRSHESFRALPSNVMEKINSELRELMSLSGLDNAEHI